MDEGLPESAKVEKSATCRMNASNIRDSASSGNLQLEHWQQSGGQ
jgi:hypothetical protein